MVSGSESHAANDSHNRGEADQPSDNNEFYLHDDEFMAKNEFPHEPAAPAPEGLAKIGALGRMINVSLECQCNGTSF